MWGLGNMDYIIWAILIALIWSNNEILDTHMKNKTKPSYNFWISVIFTVTALIGWMIVRFNK